MARLDRAAQFAPFAALTGYDAAVEEAARLTQDRIIPGDSDRMELNEKLQFLAENLSGRPRISVTYFVPDERKSGGQYVTVAGTVKKIRLAERSILLSGGEEIPLDDILKLEGELFGGLAF